MKSAPVHSIRGILLFMPPQGKYGDTTDLIDVRGYWRPNLIRVRPFNPRYSEELFMPQGNTVIPLC